MFLRVKVVGRNQYLQLVENRREGRRTRQRVAATLGRLDDMVQSGSLQAMMLSLARFGKPSRPDQPAASLEKASAAARFPGPRLVFERLWQAAELPQALAPLLPPGGGDFDAGRAIPLVVMGRLFGPDAAALSAPAQPPVDDATGVWRRQTDRALFWLGRRQESVEDRLFRARRRNAAQGGAAFLDVYDAPPAGGAVGGLDAADPGGPRPGRLAVLQTAEGRPLACGLLEANAPPAQGLAGLADHFRRRFRHETVCWASRWDGLGAENPERLGREGPPFLTGGALRSLAGFHSDRFLRRGRLCRVSDGVFAKEVEHQGRRHVLYKEERQAGQDAADRAVLLGAVRDHLRRMELSIPDNDLDFRFLTIEQSRVVVDPRKVKADARFDGLFLLRTNTQLPVAVLVARHRRLRRNQELVQGFLTHGAGRSLSRGSQDYRRGQAFAGFLALLLVHELEQRLPDEGRLVDWEGVRRGLCALAEVELECDGNRRVVCTPAAGVAAEALKALDVHLNGEAASPA